MTDILGLTTDQLRAAAAQAFGSGKGTGLAGRLHRDALCLGRFTPERHGLGPRAAAGWRRIAQLDLPTVAATQQEQFGTGTVTKRLLRLLDGSTVESVQLPMGHGRSSLCVSTQVGCARACTFCESGRGGLVRNLTAGEITAQVTIACQVARPHNLVFMGMGEPLDNLDPLLQALAVLTDRSGLAYAQDRMTVCTVGHVPGILALRRLGWKRLGLALSLNAATDAQRAQLMPHSVRYPLAEIQRALIDYRQRRNLALGIHWCLLPGINDSAADAAAIARFCAPLGRVLVHVIPYNPGTAPIAPPPSDDEVATFIGRLRAAGLAVRRRITKGRSVMAACGQLARRAARPAPAARVT
ncbi:MAG: radical SAM protein [Planctomycetes bacterium]|nr:radical SAM protein [Planctomycetota bacterium]